MQILPVIDLLGGLVVRGVAGKRAEYRPIVSPLVRDAEPDTVARAFHTQFGFGECYVADLDAIAGKPGNRDAWHRIADAGLRLWLDAGVGTVAQAERVRIALDSSSTPPVEHRLIIGLESLASLAELGELVRLLGNDQIVFSLDLQAGELLTSDPQLQQRAPRDLIAQVVDQGIRRLIVLDLADVGVGGGTRTLDLCHELHRLHPALELIAGGGVRHLQDLQGLASAGCSVALVASALHDGRLSVSDCRIAAGWP